MSSLNNNPWLQFRPLTPVGKIRTYVQLPAFDYLPAWTGASELVTQFNFSATKNFYLKNRPTKPTGVNYLLCIKYRVGDTVYRYKLWTLDGVTGLDDVPLYAAQLIKKNFVLEIWSIEGGVASQSSTINLITSVVELPSDMADLDDVAFAVGTEFNSFNNVVVASLPANIVSSTGYFRYAPAGIVDQGGLIASSWTNSGSLQVAGDDLAPLGANPDIVPGPNGFSAIDAPNMEGSISYTNSGTLFIVGKLNSWVADAVLVKFYVGATSEFSLRCGSAGDGTPMVLTQQTNNVPTTVKSTAIGELELGTWFVIAICNYGGFKAAISVNGSAVAETTLLGGITSFTKLLIDPTGLMTVADIIYYDSGLVTGGAIKGAAEVIGYLQSIYPSTGFSVPLSFQQANNGAAWLDNE
jgi:hypothetical protein